MTHRFRFGLLGENVRSATALAQTARRAEAAGFATFLLRDHFIEEPFGHQPAPLTALATVAAATERLRVGSLVLCNDYRHPVLLAKEVATLDLLSGGRFELGLGAGFSRPEYEAAGLPFDPPGVRVDRLAEALQVFKGLFGAAPFTFAGRFYTVAKLDAFPKPVAAATPSNSGRRGRPADARDCRARGQHHRDPDGIFGHWEKCCGPIGASGRNHRREDRMGPSTGRRAV